MEAILEAEAAPIEGLPAAPEKMINAEYVEDFDKHSADEDAYNDMKMFNSESYPSTKHDPLPDSEVEK
jgi:hypothetical protein